MQPLTLVILRQISRIGGVLLVSMPLCAVTLSCARVLSVAELIKTAPRLSGQLVCVRGRVTPVWLPQWKATLLTEMVPLSRKPTAGGNTVGLLEWSEETGVSGKYYKPESFGLLSGSGPNPRGSPPNSLDVTLRGVVMYKKHLRSLIPPLAPGGEQVTALVSHPYDIELVIVEVVRVRRPK